MYIAVIISSMIALLNTVHVRGLKISTHVLDISNGVPGRGVKVTAWQLNTTNNEWENLGEFNTNENGRVAQVNPQQQENSKGIYRLRFDTKDYFAKTRQKTFFPYAEVVFEVDDDARDYHVPLTLSNYGYSTYRGQ